MEIHICAPQPGHQPVWGLRDVMINIRSENILECLWQDPQQATNEKQSRDSGLFAPHSLSLPICLVLLHLSGE